ncbi:hypothetical protein GF336_04245 [Candidatus Woesearchaeota archaeon]|nr:hypothetical protein [Candidatus Woesearchaeota archaeon]
MISSRNDMLVWYITSLIVLVVAVSGLYGFGMFGSEDSLFQENRVTAAAVKVPSQNNPVEDDICDEENITNTIEKPSLEDEQEEVMQYDGS